MCIAIWHPEGAKEITDDILKMCWKNNDDGAGFAWRQGDYWLVQKGYMEYEDFLKAFKKAKINKKKEWLCHFRIGTSGLMDAGNTHPFQITDNYDKMRETTFKSKEIVMHNGVWGFGDKKVSDTMVAIKTYVEPLMPYIDDEKIFNLIGEVLECSSNRWLITSGEEIFYYGKWITDKESGILYSNEYYNKERYPVTTYQGQQYRGGAYGTSGLNPLGTYTYPTTKPLEADSYKKFINSDGEFDWDTWTTVYRSVWERLEEDANRTPMNSDHPYIDTITCTTCGMTTPTMDLDEGDCPSCGMVLVTNIEDVDDEDETVIMNETTGEVMALVDAEGNVEWDDVLVPHRYNVCPSCFREEYLMDSPYNIGDSLCCKCGAIFMKATGDVIRHDPEIEKSYKEENKAV